MVFVEIEDKTLEVQLEKIKKNIFSARLFDLVLFQDVYKFISVKQKNCSVSHSYL